MKRLEEQFLAAYDKYSSAILRHIFFRVNDENLAQDLTQETFFKAWRSIAANGREIDNLKSFFYKIANNLIIDHYRRKPRLPSSLEDIKEADVAEDPAQEKEAERMLELDAIKKHLREIGDEYEEVLLLRYVDDLSIAEISAITGKAPNNVSVTIHRGLKILKEKIHVRKNKDN